MNKFTIAASALSACGIAAGGYYVSPGNSAVSSVAPILVEGTPEQVLPRLREMRVTRFARQFGGDKAERELRAMGNNIIWENMGEDGSNTLVLRVKFLNDSAVNIIAHIEANGPDKTAVDVDVEIPDNRMTASPIVHPHDREVVAAMVEVIATEYVSSVLKRQKMNLGKQMETELIRTSGFSEDDFKALGNRLSAAFKESYEEDLHRLIGDERGAEVASAWNRELRDKASNGGFEPEKPANRWSR